MSKIKNISRSEWVIVGIVAPWSSLPTVAAAAVSYVGIEGKIGS
jgi:hypothetical protein